MLYRPFEVGGTDCRIEPDLSSERIRTGLDNDCFRAVVIHVVTIWAGWRDGLDHVATRMCVASAGGRNSALFSGAPSGMRDRDVESNPTCLWTGSDPVMVITALGRW